MTVLQRIALGKPPIVTQAGSLPTLQQGDAPPQPPEPIDTVIDEQNAQHAGENCVERGSGITCSGGVIWEPTYLPDDIIRNSLQYVDEVDLLRMRLGSKQWNDEALNEMAVRIQTLRTDALSRLAVIWADKFLANNGSMEHLETLMDVNDLCKKFVQGRLRAGASHPRCRAVINDRLRCTQAPGWLDMMPFLVQCGANTSLMTRLVLKRKTLQSIPLDRK
ncbi:unnamed protein product (mitochondrion) [Plasmodiophora brassicae]|uniref:F-box domain-containing protein n=1 Tax=Plasmodiophora brassicae TaxID=37360 RepID=A0A3P3YAJ7_PLABS|nr:unnamed protein product [Plasmodiophora brassicae]